MKERTKDNAVTFTVIDKKTGKERKLKGVEESIAYTRTSTERNGVLKEIWIAKKESDIDKEGFQIILTDKKTSNKRIIEVHDKKITKEMMYFYTLEMFKNHMPEHAYFRGKHRAYHNSEERKYIIKWLKKPIYFKALKYLLLKEAPYEFTSKDLIKHAKLTVNSKTDYCASWNINIKKILIDKKLISPVSEQKRGFVKKGEDIRYNINGNNIYTFIYDFYKKFEHDYIVKNRLELEYEKGENQKLNKDNFTYELNKYLESDKYPTFLDIFDRILKKQGGNLK